MAQLAEELASLTLMLFGVNRALGTQFGLQTLDFARLLDIALLGTQQGIAECLQAVLNRRGMLSHRLQLGIALFDQCLTRLLGRCDRCQRQAGDEDDC